MKQLKQMVGGALALVACVFSMVGRGLLNVRAAIAFLVAFVFTLCANASTDPQDIIDSATGKYDTAVAVFISAAVIGAAIMFIRKGLRGRM